MKKKVMSIVLAFALAAGCIQPGAEIAPTSKIVASDGVMAAAAKKKVKAPSVKKIQKTIAAAYGDEFMANVSLTDDEIKERFGISPSWYLEALAQIPMISANVDTLVIVKAKNAKTKKKVKAKLVEYRKTLINDTFQYPGNLLKIQASKVYSKGNYVFYIMLGFVDDAIEESGDKTKILKAYQAEDEKAIKAINSLFK